MIIYKKSDLKKWQQKLTKATISDSMKIKKMLRSGF